MKMAPKSDARIWYESQIEQLKELHDILQSCCDVLDKQNWEGGCRSPRAAAETLANVSVTYRIRAAELIESIGYLLPLQLRTAKGDPTTGHELVLAMVGVCAGVQNDWDSSRDAGALTEKLKHTIEERGEIPPSWFGKLTKPQVEYLRGMLHIEINKGVEAATKMFVQAAGGTATQLLTVEVDRGDSPNSTSSTGEPTSSNTAEADHLVLDEETLTVSRPGYSSVTVKSRLRWNLISGFANKRPGAVWTRHDIEDQWESLGGRVGSSGGAVDAALSMLKKEIDPLRLQIENVPQLGWKLKYLRKSG